MAAVDVGVAVRDEHEDVRVGIEVAHDVAEEVHAARVGPVRVVEQDDDRLRLGRWRRSTTASNSRSRSVSGSVAVGRGSVGRATSQLGHEPAELAAVPRDVVDDDVVADVRHDLAQQLGPRRVGCGHVLVATAEHHERALVVRLTGELRSQPGLADARLAREQNGGGAIDLRALPGLGEPEALVFARRERELAALAAQRRGEGRGRRDRRRPRHLERDDRLGQSFQLDLADEHEAELGVAAREAAHEVVAEDLRTIGRVAQSGRGHDRCAVTVAILPGHIARADADAHLDAPVLAALAVRPVDLPLDLVRGVHGLGRWRRTRRGCRRRAL